MIVVKAAASFLVSSEMDFTLLTSLRISSDLSTGDVVGMALICVETDAMDARISSSLISFCATGAGRALTRASTLAIEENILRESRCCKLVIKSKRRSRVRRKDLRPEEGESRNVFYKRVT